MIFTASQIDAYVQGILRVRDEHPGRQVRVRVTPLEQSKLMGPGGPFEHTPFSAGSIPHVFATNALGAHEWVWDYNVTEPVFEPFDVSQEPA